MGRKVRGPATATQAEELRAVADKLQSQLEQLDAMGAHLAAAHLDTAIARIRADAAGA